MAGRRPWLAIALAAAVLGCRLERDVAGNPIRGPRRMDAFAVLDASSGMLWKITAPGVPPVEIQYGRVPPAFVQEAPPAGEAPRPLVDGETLAVVIVTPDYVYRGECAANGTLEPRCGRWTSARPRPETVERALRGQPLDGS